MTKPLTKEQIQLKKLRRLQAKGLRQMLIYRFLNNYGYDKGEVTARAIVDDILKLIEVQHGGTRHETSLQHLYVTAVQSVCNQDGQR